MRGLNDFFESIVEVKRISRGEHQTIETMINEDALREVSEERNEKLDSANTGKLEDTINNLNSI